MSERSDSTETRGNKFGTFGGVFTPSILTILGAIMFLRANFIVGHAGIIGALLILALAKIITGLTSLSISAVSTNMQVGGGGAYFMISRVLGPQFGGAMGWPCSLRRPCRCLSISWP
jgi:amino acid transporter